MKRVLLVLLVVGLATTTVLAVPEPPHEVYGTITDQGEAAENIAVEARVSGNTVASDATDSEGYYTVKVPENYSGQNFTVYVDGTSEQTYTFASGATEELNSSGDYIDDSSSDGGDSDIGTASTGGGGVSGADDAEPKQATFEQSSETAKTASVGQVSEGQSVTTTTSDDEDSTVSSVSFSASSDADNVSVTVEDKGNQTPERTQPPQGKVYSYRNITVNGLPDAAITRGNITFRVQKTWLAKKNFTADSVALQRLVDGEWQRLDTEQTRETQTYYEYVSQTPGFSLYAITADTADDDEQQPQEPTGEPRFSIQDLTVEPREGPRPLTVTIDVTVANDGSADGTYTVDVRDDDTTIRSETVALSQGDTTSRTYQATLNRTGTHTIQVGERARAILVNPAPDENTSLFITIAVIVALALIYGFVRDRYPKLP